MYNVEVAHIRKQYGTQTVLPDLSFGIGKGEIVGFLGPNGAGKSTTFKIIAGLLQPDAGQVYIGGVDAVQHREKVRSWVGYLPENNPLYPDMYVREYLDFVAGMQGLHGAVARERVEEMIERTGLIPEYRKRIGQLSKGYRQRVGLAQALLHSPQLLLLDEPTTGLDPNQLVEIRQLIEACGEGRTILLSTHIMSEVSALCNRFLVLHQGRLVADRPVEGCLEDMEQLFYTLTR